MRRPKWPLAIRAINFLICIVLFIALVVEPSLELLVVFLGSIVTLLGLFTVSGPTRSSDWRADISRRNRETLLKRLLQDSQAMLQDPLDQVKRVALGMEVQPDAVNPLAAQPRLTDDQSQPLRPSTTIVGVFEDCQDGLLILGAPGAGKTTLLHELAVELITRAQHVDHAPIPLIVNLASWAQEQKPLDEWLVDEFALRFQSRAYGQELVDGDALLLLLDGLDEVRADARAACVNAINAYRAADRGFVQIVVCSRKDEYEEVQEHARLALDSAVLLQPLTDDQVNAYLAQGGERLAALRDVINADDQLREWAHTPLWLSVMTVAYADQSAEDVQTLMRESAGRAHLFAQYVRRMFAHKSVRDNSERGQILHWLAWLAFQMQKRNQTEFHIEELQPDWLPEERRKHYRRRFMWSTGLLFGLVVGLAGMLVGGWVGGLAGVTVGLLFGLLFGLETDISPAEQLRFSWSAFRHGFTEQFGGVTGILFFGLFFGLVFGLELGPAAGLLIGLAAGLGILTFSLIAGLEKGLTTIPLETRSSPNQGMRRSLNTALTVGLALGLALGLLLGLAGGLFYGLALGLLLGLAGGLLGLLGLLIGLAGLTVGLAIGLYNYGGFAVIQHLWLRHFLHRAGVAPKNYTAFLTRCTDLIFMRREGGGFRFYHLALRDYFADLYAQNDTHSTP